MASRLATSLKNVLPLGGGQITSLLNVVSQEKFVKTNAKLRLQRVTDLFNNYEEIHDELALFDAENEGLGQMTEIRGGFYDIAKQIEVMSSADKAASNNTVATQPAGHNVHRASATFVAFSSRTPQV